MSMLKFTVCLRDWMFVFLKLPLTLSTAMQAEASLIAFFLRLPLLQQKARCSGLCQQVQVCESPASHAFAGDGRLGIRHHAQSLGPGIRGVSTNRWPSIDIKTLRTSIVATLGTSKSPPLPDRTPQLTAR